MARPLDRQNILTLAVNKIKIWYVAFYIRLSREDARGYDESESVQNQRLILKDWLNNQFDGEEYVYVDEYVDDGVSGTTDDERPEFQRMLRDIEAGKVNCVVVKNLARSFRNYSDQGYYLDDWFVRNKVRFVSLYQQSIDTYKDPHGATNIGVPVQGVLNERHAQDTSESVRKVFDKKREKGLHIGSFAAYGYKKDPQDKNALVIDEEAAAVVRDIFTWFLDGMSKNAIVRTLNTRGVLCPSLYKGSKGLKYKNPNADNKPLWNAKTITDILKNRLYVGDMVQGRYRVRSYKIHVQDTVPENEWFVVENTHEPIIDRERFGKVQELLKRDTRTGPGQKKLYLFSGFLRCADCGKSMVRSEVRGTVYYYCRTYKEQSKAACTKHSIRHNTLEAVVLYVIRQHVYTAVSYTEVISSINKAPLKKSQSIKLDDLIAAKEKELAKITRYKQSIYQDWKDGEIIHKDYRHMHEDYEQQAETINAAIANLKAERAELEKGIDTENPFLAAFRRYENIDKLTRDVVIELIEQIKVYENGNISVKVKYSDHLRQIVEYIEANTHSAVG
ncbi:MAG TPA: recombinase family protein [Anaerovoracaceae bacterium]|nr:recombinase family protein [Anaerovoracaceae bacterium]